MASDSAVIEAAFTLGKHAGGRTLTPDGARMFSRLLDLTIRAGIANDPEAWTADRGGRSFVLETIARLARNAAEAAGKGGELTPEILRRAASQVVDEERRRLGIQIPKATGEVTSKFCFAFMASEVFDPAPGA